VTPGAALAPLPNAMKTETKNIGVNLETLVILLSFFF
jgi:hypothetical protein